MLIIKFLALSLLPLIQGNSVGPVILDNSASELLGLQTQLQGIIEETTLTVDRLRDEIHRTVLAQHQGLLYQIEHLNGIVNEAQTQAKSENKNIQSCVDAKFGALAKLNRDLNGLRECRDLENFYSIEEKLRKLKEIQASGDQCRDSDDLQVCIGGIEAKIGEIEDEIGEEIERTRKISDVCVEETLRELDLRIEEVAHGLKKCIVKIFY